MALKELRKTFGLTQVEAANSVSVPLRTYIRYESNPDESNLKYQKIVELLKDKYEITETKGIYALDKLKIILLTVIEKYKDEISFCYLFGSYAKGYGLSGLGAALGEMAKAGIQMIYKKTFKVLACGDYAIGMSEGTFGGKPTVYYDLFRVENGFIAEHWDVMEETMPKDKWANQNGKL